MRKMHAKWGKLTSRIDCRCVSLCGGHCSYSLGSQNISLPVFLLQLNAIKLIFVLSEFSAYIDLKYSCLLRSLLDLKC